MHGQHMKYLLVAAGALVVGLLAAGTSLQSILPFLMMVFMMRGLGGHGGHGGHGSHGSHGSHGGHGGHGGEHANTVREPDDAASRR
jgi:hypothetical protein